MGYRLALAGSKGEDVTLYGFLELSPEVEFLRPRGSADRIAEKTLPLWIEIGAVCLFLAGLLWNLSVMMNYELLSWNATLIGTAAGIGLVLYRSYSVRVRLPAAPHTRDIGLTPDQIFDLQDQSVVDVQIRAGAFGWPWIVGIAQPPTRTSAAPGSDLMATSRKRTE